MTKGMELTHAELETLQDLIVWIATNKPRGFVLPPTLSIIQLKLTFVLADGQTDCEIQPRG
jgi:hypothetical protein